MVFGFPLVFTFLTRTIVFLKPAGVFCVPTPVKLPHCESVVIPVESQVFGPQLAIGVA